MKYISQSQLDELVRKTKGATFATITTETDPKLKKTNNPFYVDGVCPIVKVSTMNVTLNFIYANAVNNQREREGKDTDFVPQERKWGARIPGTSLVEHNGTIYLECRVNSKPSEIFYMNKETGKEVPYEEIQEFLPTRTPSTTQDLEKEIIVRDFKLSSIKQININKEQYVIAGF